MMSSDSSSARSRSSTPKTRSSSTRIVRHIVSGSGDARAVRLSAIRLILRRSTPTPALRSGTCVFVGTPPPSLRARQRWGIDVKRDPILPGTMIADKYRIEELIGEGTMGAVYSAHNEKLDVRVA